MTVRWVGAAVLLGLFTLGCGGGGEGSRYRVSGAVKFAGEPIKTGRIYFDPDAAENKDGQQGYADIKDGKYDTGDGGKGVSGGKYVARIEGFGDPTPAYPGGKPLFTDYKVPKDLPKSTSTADFEVPASAAARLPKNPGPPP